MLGVPMVLAKGPEGIERIQILLAEEVLGRVRALPGLLDLIQAC